MEGGVHAELRIDDGSVCRIATASDSARIRSVTRSALPEADDVTVEFTADAPLGLEDVTEVFRRGDERVYRFDRPAGEVPACPCELVEETGPPVNHVRAEAEAIVLGFVAGDLDELRRIVAALRERYDGVSLCRLSRSDGPDADADLVLVDRAVLTERQREVLEIAHEMGYFDHPGGANATAVADALDVNRSTFAEHLSAAQSKLLDAILDG